jgi:hypothetical protein
MALGLLLVAVVVVLEEPELQPCMSRVPAVAAPAVTRNLRLESCDMIDSGSLS